MGAIHRFQSSHDYSCNSIHSKSMEQINISKYLSEKYGVEVPNKSPEIKQKTKVTAYYQSISN